MEQADPHVVHGTEVAFRVAVFDWFNANDDMGYPFWPNSNKTIRGVQHVVDNEVSFANTDPTMMQRVSTNIMADLSLSRDSRLSSLTQSLSVRSSDRTGS